MPWQCSSAERFTDRRSHSARPRSARIGLAVTVSWLIVAAGCAQFRHRHVGQTCTTCGPDDVVILPERAPQVVVPDRGPPSESFPEIGQPRKTTDLALQLHGPTRMLLGGRITYRFQISNRGQADATGVVLRNPIPPGLRYVDSVPGARVETAGPDGEALVWELGTVRAGGDHRVSATFEVESRGRVVNRAEVTAAGALRADATAATDVTVAQLQVEMTAPEEAEVGQSVTFDITLTNAGNTDATNVVLVDTFDAGFVHDYAPPGGVPEERTDSVRIQRLRVEPGKQERFPLTLRGTRAGLLRNQVLVTADGGLQASAEATVRFRLPARRALSVHMSGPQWRSQGRAAEFTIAVTNSGDTRLTGVKVSDQFPVELGYVSASSDGVYGGDRVDWDLGVLEPGQTRRVQVELSGLQVAQRVINRVVVTADGGVQAHDEAPLQIRPRPAGIDVSMFDLTDLIVEGGEVIYEIRVENNGDLDARNVHVQARVPAEMRLVEGGHEAPRELAIEQDRDRVSFGPADLPGRGQWVIRVRAEAVKATPSARFHIRVSGADLDPPISEEEPTTILPR